MKIEVLSRGPSGFNAVTALLKKRGVNIEDLETDAYPNSFTSSLTFHMHAVFTLPEGHSELSLLEELRQIERERKLEIAVCPAPAPIEEASA
jgi:glycine cleavage system regulatory protein